MIVKYDSKSYVWISLNLLCKTFLDVFESGFADILHEICLFLNCFVFRWQLSVCMPVILCHCLLLLAVVCMYSCVLVVFSFYFIISRSRSNSNSNSLFKQSSTTLWQLQSTYVHYFDPSCSMQTSLYISNNNCLEDALQSRPIDLESDHRMIN